MKIRTAYFKVSDMGRTTTFWEGVLGFSPHKKSKWWVEFKCENINLGFLLMEKFETSSKHINFVPVFEFKENELSQIKERALSLGARIVLDIKDHPDKKSYVLADPSGNEFEITYFHD